MSCQTEGLGRTMRRPAPPTSRLRSNTTPLPMTRSPPNEPLPPRPPSEPLPPTPPTVSEHPSEPLPAIQHQPSRPDANSNPSEASSDPEAARPDQRSSTPPLPPRKNRRPESSSPHQAGRQRAYTHTNATTSGQQPGRQGAHSNATVIVFKPPQHIATEQKKLDKEREKLRTKPLPNVPGPRPPVALPRRVTYENVVVKEEEEEEEVEPRPKRQRPPKPKRTTVLRSSSLEYLDRRSLDVREVSGNDLDTIIDLQMELLKVSPPEVGGARKSGSELDWSRRSSIKGWGRGRKASAKNLGVYLKNRIAVQHIREHGDTPESVPQVCETIQDLLDKKMMARHIIPGVKPEVQSYIGMFLLNDDKWTDFADAIDLTKEDHELIRHVAREYHYLPFAICLAHWRRVKEQEKGFVTKSALIDKLREINARDCLINRLRGV